MHILLTRPLEDCLEMILKFKSLGHQVSHLPLLSINKIQHEEINFSDYGGIIFTSASSVRAFFEIMTKDFEHSQLLENLQKTKVIAIGPFTADELKKLNVENVIADVHTITGSFDALVKALSLAEAI